MSRRDGKDLLIRGWATAAVRRKPTLQSLVNSSIYDFESKNQPRAFLRDWYCRSTPTTPAACEARQFSCHDAAVWIYPIYDLRQAE